MAKSEGHNHTKFGDSNSGSKPPPHKENNGSPCTQEEPKTVILFAKEEHRGSDQILSCVVGKVVQEQPNAAVKPATEIGIAENRV